MNWCFVSFLAYIVILFRVASFSLFVIRFFCDNRFTCQGFAQITSAISLSSNLNFFRIALSNQTSEWNSYPLLKFVWIILFIYVRLIYRLLLSFRSNQFYIGFMLYSDVFAISRYFNLFNLLLPVIIPVIILPVI